MIPQGSELYAVSGEKVFQVVGWDETTRRPCLVRISGYRVRAEAIIPPEGSLIEFHVTQAGAEIAADSLAAAERQNRRITSPSS